MSAPTVSTWLETLARHEFSATDSDSACRLTQGGGRSAGGGRRGEVGGEGSARDRERLAGFPRRGRPVRGGVGADDGSLAFAGRPPGRGPGVGGARAGPGPAGADSPALLADLDGEWSTALGPGLAMQHGRPRPRPGCRARRRRRRRGASAGRASRDATSSSVRVRHNRGARAVRSPARYCSNVSVPRTKGSAGTSAPDAAARAARPGSRSGTTSRRSPVARR